MSDMKIITVSMLSDAIEEIVEDHIRLNEDAIRENLLAAANAAKRDLAGYRGEWIGKENVGHSRDFHSKGWRIYRENWAYGEYGWERAGVHSAVLASYIEPSLAHLLEFGHDVYARKGVPIGIRTKATKCMSNAFDKGVEKLLEARID